MAELNPIVEKLLAYSVEQYGELLQHTEKLVIMLKDNDYSMVEKHSARLQQIQAAANQQDEQLLPLLTADLAIWKEHPLFQKRLDSIKSIVKINKSLLPKINAAMAVTSSELAKLSGGRTALAGYASHSNDKRGNLGVG